MTHVMQGFAISPDTDNRLRFFSVEVITFDGDSQTVEVEARNAEEAQNIAASEVGNVDYTMVQAVCE
ncbi:MAG: hypothetical protein K2G90_02725 [Muribaculaceae bacterium]|nr:hypothetical protein [Muribaculaceae bacterium]